MIMIANPLEGLKTIELATDKIAAYGVAFEELLGIIGLFEATTLTRFLTNQDQSMIDFQLNPEFMTDGNRLITDGEVSDGKIATAGYVADISHIPDGINSRNNIDGASHQIMVWVSKDFLPHKEVKALVQDNIKNSAGRVRMEPNTGRESRV